MVSSFFSRISNGGKSPMRIWLVLAPPIILILWGGYYFIDASRFVSTDNAYVKADKVSVSSEVSGRLVAVGVDENQQVEAGQFLFSIDPQPYKIAQASAEAALKNVVSDFGALKARYRQKQAELKKAQVDEAYYNRDYKRWKSLANTRVASEAKLDEARHAYDGAREDEVKTAQELSELIANLEGDPALPLEKYAPYKEAAEKLAKARLDMSRTRVTAPVAGVVSKTGSLQVGNYDFAGVPMLSIVKNGHLWIEANVKETNLTHMRVGQKATADVDTFSGRKLKVRVSSIAPATGAEFSILPPQNATGNWVKVVQRVPVRLELVDPRDSPLLRAGMSVTVSVDTGAYYALPHWLRSIFGGDQQAD